jgi:hypothetical protein
VAGPGPAMTQSGRSEPTPILAPMGHRPHAPEFRHQMVDLVRPGRTPEDLSREFEPTGRFDRRPRNAVDFATCEVGPHAT